LGLPALRNKSNPTFSAKDLRSLKLLSRFREVLDDALAQLQTPIHRSFADPNRNLQLGDYLSLFLVGLFNPIARTVRGIAQASSLPKVCAQLGVTKVSLGSFSETQHLVEPSLLEHLFTSLAGELPDLKKLPPSLHSQRWMARDSSLFPALPRMAWALYGGGREGFKNNAVRLHVSFDLLKDAPARVQITPGKTCERKTLRAEVEVKPGGAYVGDRYFGESYQFFALLSAKKCRYLIRLIDHGIAPTVEEEIPVTAEDAKSGIERQAWVRLGAEGRNLSERLRYIWLRGCTGELLHLATNLPPTELSAGDAALLYKSRWQVEYFFRWVKCLMGCGHWLAESPRGVTNQLYLALIGALLLQLDLGKRPSKRIWELYQWHQVGMLDDDELARALAAQLAREEQAQAKKTKAYPN
jgi:hypothetical protein